MRLSVSPRTAGRLLFLVLWAVYGATIDKRDLHHYSLHHKGAEVIAEHHRFYFREHAEGQEAGGDAFVHDGKVYPNKQPGSLMAGALVYAVLLRFGLTYLHSYFLTAALVTLFTSALCTALAALLLYRIALDWTGSMARALLSSMAFGLGSTAWPYSGTLHHDAMAAAFLVGALYCRERRGLLSGILLGLALTCSLLVSAVVAVLGGFFLWWSRAAPGAGARVGRLILGGLLGVLPLAIYNTVSFGNPLGQAVIVSGQWREVAPRIDVAGAAALASSYAVLLAGFTPISLLGLIGLAFFPASRHRERRLLGAVVATQLGFVLLLGATGACQFGPRMLLPALPFMALGLTGFATAPRRGLVACALAAVCVLSIGFNLLGALYGTMNCVHDRWAVARYLQAARHGEGFSLPLLEALGVPRGDASRRIERERAMSFAAEAREAVGRGDYPEARRRLDAAAALAPDLALVHQYRANVDYLDGDLAGAAAALERALELDPDSALLRQNLERLRAGIAGSGQSPAPIAPSPGGFGVPRRSD